MTSPAQPSPATRTFEFTHEPFEAPPPSAVVVWTVGDKLMVRFEGHTVDIPVDEPRRLITVLKAREAKGRKSRIGEPGAPPQLEIYDAIKEAWDKRSAEKRAERIEAAAEKRRAQGKVATKRADKQRFTKEMDELMEAAGL